MVVVEFAYEDMKGMVDLPLDKMVSSLNELGAPSEYEPEVKKIITELTPNRPDWYSMEGLARALRAYHFGKHPGYLTKKSDYAVKVDPSVAKVRPYTVCAVVKGLEFNDQRIRDVVLLQEKLLATLGRKVKKFGLGIYPLHAIRFPVRYTTLKPTEIRYVPLGSEGEMDAPEILEKHKKGQQYGYLLEGHDRYPVFVDADGKIMALIPIVNSAETGKIDESTREIFVEVSGMDMNACKAALNILACTFADMGGTVFEVNMEYAKESFCSPDLRPVVMKLDLARISKALGIRLGEKEAKGLLARMGYAYGKGKVAIPPYRADIMSWVDVMEDIAIAYGYNNFKPTVPDFFSPGELIKKYDNVDEIMRGMGFLEVKTFILTNKDRLKDIGYDGELIEITNPSTVDFTVVRPNLIADMLGAFTINKMKGLPQKFYEIGIVHAGSESSKRLVFGTMDKGLEFSRIRGYLQALASEAGFEFMLEQKEMLLFDKGLSCDVMVNGRKIGVLGKIDGKVLEKFGLAFDVFVCELEL